jgi:hypothetical protein
MRGLRSLAAKGLLLVAALACFAPTAAEARRPVYYYSPFYMPPSVQGAWGPGSGYKPNFGLFRVRAEDPMPVYPPPPLYPTYGY